MSKIPTDAQWSDLASRIKNKADSSSVPTAVSDLTNDEDFQTGQEVTDAIAAAVGGLTGFDYQVVSALPASGEKGIIYLVPNSGTNPNIYDEYIWIEGTPSGSFEKIGTTEVDLSDYVKIGSVLSSPNNVAYVGTDNIVNSAVTTGKIANGAVTAGKIDFTTMVYGSSRYAQNQSVSANTWTTILFPNNIVTDTEAIQYNSDGTFTIKKAGWWMISAQLGGSDSVLTVSIFVNGVEYKANRGQKSSDYQQLCYTESTACAKLSVGDLVSVQGYSLTQFNINSRTRGNVDICLISPTS